MAFVDKDSGTMQERLRIIQDEEKKRRLDAITRLIGLRLSGDAVGFGWRAGAEGGPLRNVGEEIALQNEINMARAMRPEHFQEILEKGQTQVGVGSWGISKSSHSEEQPGGTKTVNKAGGPHLGRKRRGFIDAEEYEKELKNNKKGFRY